MVLHVQESSSHAWEPPRGEGWGVCRLTPRAPHDPAAPPLRPHPRNWNQDLQETAAPSFPAAFPTVATTQKQPPCPPTEEWIKEMWYLHTMEYYPAVKREGKPAICDLMHATWGHCAEWNRPDRERQPLPWLAFLTTPQMKFPVWRIPFRTLHWSCPVLNGGKKSRNAKTLSRILLRGFYRPLSQQRRRGNLLQNLEARLGFREGLKEQDGSIVLQAIKTKVQASQSFVFIQNRGHVLTAVSGQGTVSQPVKKHVSRKPTKTHLDFTPFLPFFFFVGITALSEYY